MRFIELVPLAATLAMAACAPVADHASPGAITYAEYKERYATPSPRGGWIVEGDIWLLDELALRHHYDRYFEDPEACAEGTVCQSATVKHVDDRDRVWNVHDKLALSYCIADLGSASNTNRVRDALDQATREWELAADVNFVHVASEDGASCTENNGDVLFRVRRGDEPSTLLAEAFFPDYPANKRDLLFYAAGLALSDAELLGVTRHELGHILGLRHEHVRFNEDGSSNCPEAPTNIRAVTFADQHSIMGYHFCTGIAGNDWARKLSRGDALGGRYLYNLPRGHGPLGGEAFNQANSFLDNGAGDDVLWFRPGSDTYTLWHFPRNSAQINYNVTEQCPRVGQGRDEDSDATGFGLADPAGGSGICRDGVDPDRRPFSVQWYRSTDANYNREVFFYGPGPALEDGLLVNNNNGTFDRYPATVNGFYVPLTGAFHPPAAPSPRNRSEILWYRPGSGIDYLWQVNDAVQGSSTVVSPASVFHPHEGYWDVLVGSFDQYGTGGDEILWFSDCFAEVWKGNGASGFDVTAIDMTVMNGGCDAASYKPLLGDFNGDSYGDILWYQPGTSRPDPVTYTSGPLSSTLFGFKDLQIAGLYRPLVGDFNGDYIDDVFWYNPGPGADSVWLFDPNIDHTAVSVTVNGDYAPIVGHFNNDGCADILWYDAVNDLVHVWASRCDGTFTNQGTRSAPQGGYPVGWGIGR